MKKNIFFPFFFQKLTKSHFLVLFVFVKTVTIVYQYSVFLVAISKMLSFISWRTSQLLVHQPGCILYLIDLEKRATIF